MGPMIFQRVPLNERSEQQQNSNPLPASLKSGFQNPQGVQ